MSIASLLSIKVTSPITHMVSSAVRGVAASLLGVWLFHDVISTYVKVIRRVSVSLKTVPRGRASSIAIILGGSVFYTWVKHKETEAAKHNSYTQVPLEDVEEGKIDPTKRHRDAAE